MKNGCNRSVSRKNVGDTFITTIVGGIFMKRFLGTFMALAMIFTCLCGTTAFAAEVEKEPIANTVVADANESEIVPYGSLSGYGQHWYNAGEKTHGTFKVEVKGIGWAFAQVTVNIENFNSNAKVFLKIYRQDGTFAWGTADYLGGCITMANKDEWHNYKFLHAPTGVYTVEYDIVTTDQKSPGSGRINCWIY